MITPAHVGSGRAHEPVGFAQGELMSLLDLLRVGLMSLLDLLRVGLSLAQPLHDGA